MLVIRLSRTGAIKAPFYHILVADSRKPNCGRFVEQVGFYNPMARGKETRLQLNQERINHWTSLGAQPSDRVSYLLSEVKKGVAVNAPAPKRGELKVAQIEASHKAAKVKAKAEAETAKAEATPEIAPEAETKTEE